MTPPNEPCSSLAANMSTPSEPCSSLAANMTPPNEPCCSLAANSNMSPPGEFPFPGDDSFDLSFDDGHSSAPTFTAEQLELFEKRYDNGYDVLIDPDYVAWLKWKSGKECISEGGGTNGIGLSKDLGEVISPKSGGECSSVMHTSRNKGFELARSPVSHSLASAQKALTDVSEFLIFPSTKSTSKKSKPPGSARVLTSAQSLAIMKEKELKKREEEEAKIQRKREREEKKTLREAEKEKKAKERELKAIERQKKAEEKAAEIEERRKQRELKKNQSSKKGFTKVFVTRSKSGYAPQNSESGTNECAVCFGLYSDDVSTDGTPAREWVQCVNKECSKWMHADCASKDEEGSSVCIICGAIFK